MNEPSEQPNTPRPPVAQLAQRTVTQLQTTEAAKTAPQERLESAAAKPAAGSAEPLRQRPPAKSVRPDDECLSPRVREAYERRQAELSDQEEIMSFFRRVAVRSIRTPRTARRAANSSWVTRGFCRNLASRMRCPTKLRPEPDSGGIMCDKRTLDTAEAVSCICVKSAQDRFSL